MALTRCVHVHGGHRVHDGYPLVDELTNVMTFGWGLYDSNRCFVSGSGYARGVAQGERLRLETFCPGPSIDLDPDTAPSLPEGRYFWLGHLHVHFGHFLLSGLQRLWAIAHCLEDDMRIAVADSDIDAAFALPHVRDVMAALGLERERFIHVSPLSRIPHVVAPQPGFVEMNSVFTQWGAFMRDLGTRLAGDGPAGCDDTPVYLSKDMLSAGVRGIDNEGELAECLEAAGVRIVRPETMTLSEQVAVWQRHRNFAGFSSSALHTAAFVSRRNLICLHPDGNVLTNQTLIDAVGEHNAMYLDASTDIEPLGSAQAFHSLDRLTRPRETADRLLKAFDRVTQQPQTLRPRPRGSSIARAVSMLEPLGDNLSRHRPALQSSIQPGDSLGHDPAADAAGALSGVASARYQMHTRSEPNPWWQVDLGTPCLLTEVRVFNRRDGSLDRARPLVFLVSMDGEDWFEAHRKSPEMALEGGPLAEPYHWRVTGGLVARYVRVMLDADDFLHLDQVEVFGVDAASAEPYIFA